MGTISAFTHVSLDGYFAGANGEIDWFKNTPPDPEFEAFSGKQARAESTLLFGRTTYEMMQSYWPTEEARKNDPDMAKVMSDSPKIVFSKSLQSVEESPHWQDVELARDIDADALAKAKEVDDRNFTILGSGSIVQQLTELGLIDAYQLVLHPVVLGAGKSLFAGVDQSSLALVENRAFKNGLVWLRYEGKGDAKKS
jgi:dihydrofolate reductase